MIEMNVSAVQEYSGRSHPAWERRDEYGIFAAFARTFYELLFFPGRALRGLAPDGSVFGPVLYAFFAFTLGNVSFALALCIGYPPTKKHDLFREFFYIFAAANAAVPLQFLCLSVLTGLMAFLLFSLRITSVRPRTLFRMNCYSYGTMSCLVILIFSVCYWFMPMMSDLQI